MRSMRRSLACLALLSLSHADGLLLRAYPRCYPHRCLSPRLSVLESKPKEPASRLDRDGDGTITKEELDAADLLAIAAETNLYKELSRQTRQDVFDYSLWEENRSADRFQNNLLTLFNSRVIRSIWRECFVLVLITATLCLYNDAMIPSLQSMDFDGDWFEGLAAALGIIHLPMIPWTLTSSFLSLLLVFRTNSSYQRWAEARAVWGAVTNTVRDTGRQISWRVDDRESVKVAVNRLAAFPWALQGHVGSPKVQGDCDAELAKILNDEDLNFVRSSSHKPMAILGLLTASIDKLEIEPIRAQKVDQGLTILMDNLGKCERIFKTPIPRVYTRHTERFLGIWITSLPIGLYDAMPTHWTMLPAVGFLSIFLLGISELANLIEEPFSILPLKTMCGGIQGSIFADFENAGKATELELRSQSGPSGSRRSLF